MENGFSKIQPFTIHNELLDISTMISVSDTETDTNLLIVPIFSVEQNKKKSLAQIICKVFEWGL